MEDNARKFTVGTIDNEFLREQCASSFLLVVDWLETNEDSESKLALKTFEDGRVQILLISKVTKEGKRVAEKKDLTRTEYDAMLLSSTLRLEKERFEFKFHQGGIEFTLKYDKFSGGKMRILEVDASTDEERASFNPDVFPYKLKEVTGDQRYYGYRVASLV